MTKPRKRMSTLPVRVGNSLQAKRFEVRIGVDVGKVILNGSLDDLIKPARRSAGQKVKDTFLGAPYVTGVFKYLKRLVERYGAKNIWLVSTVGDRETADKVLAWFSFHKFYERTGILRDNVKFCLTFEDKAKVASSYRFTHFIDDRIDVLYYMRRVVPYRLLFREDTKVTREFAKRYSDVTKGVIDGGRMWRMLAATISQTIRPDK